MADRAIREKETMHKTGYTRSSMWKAIREGRFPRPVKLPGTRAVAWSENAVNAWVDAQFKNVPVEPAPTGWVTGGAAVKAMESNPDGAGVAK
jgi:prophage regulatory protein